jgi:hypothetical protein
MCECLCHRVGTAIHIVPCCDRPYVVKAEPRKLGSSFTVLRISKDEAKSPNKK